MLLIQAGLIGAAVTGRNATLLGVWGNEYKLSGGLRGAIECLEPVVSAPWLDSVWGLRGVEDKQEGQVQVS